MCFLKECLIVMALILSSFFVVVGCSSSSSEVTSPESDSFITDLTDAAEIYEDVSSVSGNSSNNSIANTTISQPVINPEPSPGNIPASQKTYDNVNISGETHETFPAGTSMQQELDETNQNMMNQIQQEMKNQK